MGTRAITNDQDVIDICMSDDYASSLAKKYNVVIDIIYKIKTRQSYTKITQGIDIVPCRMEISYKQQALTDDEARAVFKDPRTIDEICEDYDISRSTVSNIRTGKRYAKATQDLPGKRFRPTEETIIAIYKSNESHKALAKRYGLSVTSVYKIKAGLTHTKITVPLRHEELEAMDRPNNGLEYKRRM